ncbi:hypothetical protein KY359_03225 [Candidatus Woesearchaeota archaeon]|nr:hypothetical protein [Candidatus Woesearchaeota archaeon]
MSKEMLLKETGKYIEDYLVPFVIDSKNDDIRFFFMEREITPEMAEVYKTGTTIDDLHRSRFSALYNSVPEASMRSFIDAVSVEDSPVIIDIGSLHGEEFSLWVASQNPSAEVHIYNPQEMDAFPPYLFNGISPDRFFKLKPDVRFDKARQEECTNALYAANGLDNVHQYLAAADRKCIEEHVTEAGGRKVIIFSDRTPTAPADLASEIALAVKGNPDAHMIITPYPNTAVSAYQDDRVMQMINRFNFLENVKGMPTSEPKTNAATRLFTMMQQYYALKVASAAGDRAKVYRETEFDTGFPFHHPTHYVSTIAPLEGDTR